MIAILLSISSMLWAAHPLEVAIQEKGWCTRGIGIEKLATSRPWVSSSGERIVLMTDPPIGSVRFEIFGAHISGTAFVSCHEKVAAAVKDLGPGEAFSDQNIKWVETDVAHLSRSGFFRTADELKSLEARGFVRSGTILSRMQVQNSRWVIAGAPVQVVHEGPQLKITAQGKALQSGSQNDWVRVENLQTHKTVLAQVVKPSTVMTRGSHVTN